MTNEKLIKAIEDGTATNEMVAVNRGWTRCKGEMIKDLSYPTLETVAHWSRMQMWQSPSKGMLTCDLPNWLANTDEALTLIPDGWVFLLGNHFSVIHIPSPSTKKAMPKCLLLRLGEIYESCEGYHKEIPKAIILAVLKIPHPNNERDSHE